MTLFYHGEPAATTTRHDNRLLMSLLRHYDRPGTAAVAEPHLGDPSTDTATIMWQLSFDLIGRKQGSHLLNTFLLQQLLKLRRDPPRLDEHIQTAAYMVERARVDLEQQLEKANAGPEGTREAARDVTFKLKPVKLSAEARAHVDTVMAYRRGEGPPLTIELTPLPEGAPHFKVDPLRIR